MNVIIEGLCTAMKTDSAFVRNSVLKELNPILFSLFPFVSVIFPFPLSWEKDSKKKNKFFSIPFYFLQHALRITVILQYM